MTFEFGEEIHAYELDEEYHKKPQFQKKINFFFFRSCPTFVFDQKLFIILVSQINFMHKLYFDVHYETAYHHKKFQNFSIKNLTTIT